MPVGFLARQVQTPCARASCDNDRVRSLGIFLLCAFAPVFERPFREVNLANGFRKDFGAKADRLVSIATMNVSLQLGQPQLTGFLPEQVHHLRSANTVGETGKLGKVSDLQLFDTPASLLTFSTSVVVVS